ncbi:MAG TPA: hypothetical protein VGS07_30310 [Thermoanaerobaculia bacterium]|jgi:hypothetical protein|nr:hypothetical protein [Thermoanaerobaculia bacterium]
MRELSLDLAIRIFRIILKHMLEGIPVYGRLLKLTVEILEAIEQEARDSGIDADHAELIAAVRTLPPAIVRDEVERALSTRKDLPAKRRRAFKRELEQVPVQFASIIAEIEASETRAQREARQAVVDAEAAKRKYLRERLKEQVSARYFDRAYTTIIELREAGEWSRDLSKLERFLFRRTHVIDLPDDWPLGVIALPMLALGMWLRSGCFSIGLIVMGLANFGSFFEKFVPVLESAFFPLIIRRSVARVVLAIPFLATLIWFLVFRK